MKCIDYRAVEKFPIKTPTYGIRTGFITVFHYIMIQYDAPKGDPWLLYML